MSAITDRVDRRGRALTERGPAPSRPRRPPRPRRQPWRSADSPISANPSWTVYHGDALGSGVGPTVATVHTAAPAWKSPTLDGQLYGEPLVAGGQVYAATENNTVYALSSMTGAIVWSTHLAPPVPAASLPCGDIQPTVGITGTPVVDLSRGEIFVVADELVAGQPRHTLVGLSTSSGKLELSEDVDPAGALPTALLQRTGLNLDNGQVVFGFGATTATAATIGDG